jgi:hypothetical protein
LAWNEVKDGVVGAPPEIPDAAELANRLNGAESSVANANPPMPIVEALQTIEFRLDRCGAALESESKLAILAAPRYFDFNRPFLVYMQKRGAEHPFFVMWVDNAELLVRE